MKVQNNNNQTTKEKLPLSPKEGGTAFSSAVIAVLAFSLLFSVALQVVKTANGAGDEIFKSQPYLYFAFLIPQIALIAVIAIFSRKQRLSLFDMGFKKFHPKYVGIALALFFGVFFSLSRLNDLFVNLLRSWGLSVSAVSIPDVSGFLIVPVLIVVALLPALCEETVFRGIIANSTKRMSTVSAVIAGGVLFSLFHQSAAQTIYQFICGCLYTLLALRSGSVIPTIIIHFLNNALIIILTACGITEISGVVNIVLICVSALVLAATVAYLIFFDRSNNVKKKDAISSKELWIFSLPGLLVCVLLWITGLFAA